MPTLRLGSAGESVSQVQAMLKLMGFYDGPVDGFYREQTQVAVTNFQTAAGIQADGIVGQTTWQYLLPSPDNTSSATIPVATTTALEPTPEPVPEPIPAAATPEPTPVASNPAPANSAPANPASTNSTPANPAPASPAPAATNPSSAVTSTTPANPNPSVDLPVLRLGTHGPAVVRLQERLKALGFYSGELDGVFGQLTEVAVQQMQRRHNLQADGVVGPATWSVIFRN
jgi:peptidoglycan hydrolase-like protein with peptidoglycan-binding domain